MDDDRLPKAVYMVVSRDEYEFPLMMADTAKELASMCGLKGQTIGNTVSNAMCQARKRGTWCKYRKVRIDFEDEEGRA